jgi:hypothetical protein
MKTFYFSGCSLVLIFISTLIFAVQHYYREYEAQTAALNQLTKEYDTNLVILNNQNHTIQMYDKASKDEQRNRQRHLQQSQERIIYLRAQTQTNTCAGQPVPRAAVNQLREHADKINRTAAGADPREPAGDLSGTDHRGSHDLGGQPHPQ